MSRLDSGDPFEHCIGAWWYSRSLSNRLRTHGVVRFFRGSGLGDAQAAVRLSTSRTLSHRCILTTSRSPGRKLQATRSNLRRSDFRQCKKCVFNTLPIPGRVPNSRIDASFELRRVHRKNSCSFTRYLRERGFDETPFCVILISISTEFLLH